MLTLAPRSDALVQRATGQTVAQIFAEDGEPGFREVEATVLNEVSSYGRLVVSTGGGIVQRKTNWGHLRNGIVIYLDVPLECAPPASCRRCHCAHARASQRVSRARGCRRHRLAASACRRPARARG
jgi:shikimate kinase